MSNRKPLDEGCIGGLWCPVMGHVVKRYVGKSGAFKIAHVPLTAGQKRTLHERRAASRRPLGE